MAFLRTANAKIVSAHLKEDDWNAIRAGALGGKMKVSSDNNISDYSPDKYLLTHCTIIASVDLEEDGPTNDKGWPYMITAETEQYVNSNQDAWERELLLATFHTFRGAENYCFGPDTPILMSDGTYKPIHAIELGNKVITHTGSVGTVTRTFCRDVDEDVRAVSFDRFKDPVLVTGNHPFRVIDLVVPPVRRSRRGKLRNSLRYQRDATVRALRDGSGPFKDRIKAKESWTAVEDCSVGTFALGPEYKCGTTSISEDRAVLFGYYLAEGCQVTKTDCPENSWGVVITPGIHERNVVDDIVDRVKRAFPDTAVKITTSQSSTWDVKLLGHEIGSWMLEHGGQAPTKGLSEKVFDWDRESLLWMLASWLNGDESLGRDEAGIRMRGHTTSESLAHQMFRVAEMCGIKAHVTFTEKDKNVDTGSRFAYIKANGETVYYPIITRHDLWELFISRDQTEEIRAKAVRWKNYKKGSSRKRSAFAWWNGKRVHKISRNEKILYQGKVYNFEVEGDNSYVIYPGVAVHNCEHIQIPELSKGKIVDAVARDIGDSVYVDILVATNRKHTDLIADIEEGNITTLSMGCFLPGTQVSMADGRRVAIEDIMPGDMVLTHEGRAREVNNQQIKIGQFNIQEIQAVGVPSKIYTTDNHPFFVFRAAEKCACGCEEPLPNYALGTDQTYRKMTRRFKHGHDKRIYNGNANYTPEEEADRKAQMEAIRTLKMEEVEAGDLKPGDFLCFPRSTFGDPEEVPSEGKARLIGYFLAEGSYLKAEGERTGVEFSFSYDERATYASEVADLIESEFGCNARLYPREARGNSRVHANGKELAEWFYRHCGEYGNRKVLSTEMMCWPVPLQKALLGAWINGDGSVGAANKITVGVTTSYDLICQLHAMAARCGIYTRIECRDGKEAADLREVVNGGLVRHEETGKLPSFHLVLGQTQALEMQQYTDKVAGSKWGTQNLRVMDDVVMFPITSVTPRAYVGPVYDLEVDEDHSYLVEGVAVHNCTVEYTICSKCGTIAEDDTKLCTCIKYAKGNHFYDKKGHRRKIAELCGHKSDPASVKFIEASWVENPAFKGAVLRNILKAEEVEEAAIKAAFETDRIVDPDAMQKAASATSEVKNAFNIVASFFRSGQFDFGDAGGEEKEDGEDGKAAEPEKPAMDELADEVKDFVRNKARKELREEIQDKPAPAADAGSESTNDNLVESRVRASFGFPAFKRRFADFGNDLLLYRMYEGLVSIKTGGWKSLSEKGFSGRDILALSFFIDQARGKKDHLDRSAYEAISKIGGTAVFENPIDYLNACGRALGVKKMSTDQAKALIYKGQLYSYGVDA